ncbi:uncharacterized protein TNCV_1218291 [Trichonephila clavipes]|nr:uncharacterized protein TNCV_1218291 [Trichonephila clavipes]
MPIELLDPDLIILSLGQVMRSFPEMVFHSPNFHTNERITSTAKDVCIGCASKEQETFIRQKLHKRSFIDTNGLPHQIVYVNNTYYMITPSIDVTDGLENGAVGKLVHVETNDEGLVKTIWIEFPVLPQIGEKLRRKKTISPYLYILTE